MIKRPANVALLALLPLSLLAACASGTSTKTAVPSTVPTVPTTSSTTTGTGGTVGPGGTGGTGTTSTRATTGGTGASGPTTTKGGTAGTIQLTDKDNGTTVRVSKGTTIGVVLSSTSWTIAPAPNATVLQQLSDVTSAPAPIGTCIPGEGCGTVTVTYKAVHSGQAQISASRMSCGEARSCTGTQGVYSVQIVVTDS